MKYIDTIGSEELHIREGILHMYGKRFEVQKDIWIYVGQSLNNYRYFETDQPNRQGFTKFMELPRSDQKLIGLLEEFGLENASQSGKQKIIIREKDN
jgi:hypothetical protein